MALSVGKKEMIAGQFGSRDFQQTDPATIDGKLTSETDDVRPGRVNTDRIGRSKSGSVVDLSLDLTRVTDGCQE